jgi:hypothetical protein
MTTPTVEVGGTEPTNIIDVTYSNPSGGNIGQAEITVGNSGSNRSLFESGADVVIKQNGTVEWSGEVIGKPSNQERENLTLSVEAETKAGQAEYGKVSRPFIEMSRAEIVREAVDYEVEPYTRARNITNADSTTNWSSDSQIFEVTDDSKGINKHGSDTLFVGIYEDESETYDVTFDAVPATSAPGRRVLIFETRLLVNNKGDVFDVYVELVDDDGISYEWEVPVQGTASWEVYELAVEDADISTGGSPGTLTYTFDVDGNLPEDRAAAIDMARATPFRLQDRRSGLSHDVDDTDDQITRRVDDSILSIADSVAVEAGATIFVDETDTLVFESAGDVPAPYEIRDDADTLVVGVDVDRDFDVKNQVTVQGEGDLTATYEDTSSIEFYNAEAPRPEPINDGSLRTRDQLAARARGFLNNNAWEDSAITFTLAGSKWREVRQGQSIVVDWPKEDVSGTFIVDEVGRTSEGYTTIGVSGNTEL